MIALTAYAHSEDRARCIAVGCDDYDVKPIDLSRLLMKIQSYLERAATAGFVAATPTIANEEGLSG